MAAVFEFEKDKAVREAKNKAAIRYRIYLDSRWTGYAIDQNTGDKISRRELWDEYRQAFNEYEALKKGLTNEN